MPRQGLNEEIVIRAAIELIEQKGNDKFSIRELADVLKVKPASLYNHISSIESVYYQVADYAVEALVSALHSGIEGYTAQEAVYQLAYAYRRFGKEHYELYKIIMTLPLSKDEDLAGRPSKIMAPISCVLKELGVEESQLIHQMRILRSVMHGFLMQEELGYFKDANVDTEESYKLAIRSFVHGIHLEPEKGRI